MTLPWDSPLARVEKDWEWGDPSRDLHALTVELLSALTAKTPNEAKAKKSDLIQIDRPWAKKKQQKVLGGTAMPIPDLDAWLAGDFEPVESTTE